MAKYKKDKLSWKPSTSDQVAGYMLYWSKDETISYSSNFIELGNVSEVYLPDIFKYIPRKGESIRLGISAVGIDGNESDITILTETYQATAPSAPADFSFEYLDDFKNDEASESVDKDPQQDEWEELARMAEPLLKPRPTQGRGKYYDDVGYRVLEIDKKPD